MELSNLSILVTETPDLNALDHYKIVCFLICVFMWEGGGFSITISDMCCVWYHMYLVQLTLCMTGLNRREGIDKLDKIDFMEISHSFHNFKYFSSLQLLSSVNNSHGALKHLGSGRSSAYIASN